MALKGNFYHLSLNGKNIPHFPILTPNTLSDFKNEPEKSKNYVFEQIIEHSLNFRTLPSLISGLNPKFDYSTRCVLNLSLVSFEHLSLSKVIEEKPLGWLSRTPRPKSGRVKRFQNIILFFRFQLHLLKMP